MVLNFLNFSINDFINADQFSACCKCIAMFCIPFFFFFFLLLSFFWKKQRNDLKCSNGWAFLSFAKPNLRNLWRNLYLEFKLIEDINMRGFHRIIWTGYDHWYIFINFKLQWVAEAIKFYCFIYLFFFYKKNLETFHFMHSNLCNVPAKEKNKWFALMASWFMSHVFF